MQLTTTKAAGEAYRQVKLLTGPASPAALGLRAQGDDFLIVMQIARYTKERRIP